MKNKIYDYDKSCFKWAVNDLGEYIYYIKIKNDYIEVSKEVYLVCLRSYEKMKYDRKREVARSIQYFEDIDQATPFIFLSKTSELNTKIYLKDLANQAIKEIHNLPEKYKDIAVCIFLKEMTIAETSKKLGIPISTVGKRKIKIQKITLFLRILWLLKWIVLKVISFLKKLSIALVILNLYVEMNFYLF